MFLPLEWAPYDCNTPEPEVRILIGNGVVLEGTYALHLAAQFGCIESLRLLIEVGEGFDGLRDAGCGWEKMNLGH
jgi:hypothetical protein